MAENKGERRMLFDTRGRRKNVIRVVYALLALLMGGSLFLTVGPFNLGELAGGGGTSSATEVAHERAERIEERLATSPNDEELLLALIRARIQAGNAQVERDPETGRPGTPPPEAVEDYRSADRAWTRYLKLAGDEPNASVAQLVAFTSIALAEGSTSLLASQSYIRKATEAQRIAAEQRPNVGSLTTLAIYQYFNGEFAGAEKTIDRATKGVPKAEAKNIERQMVSYRKNAERFDRRNKRLEKVAERLGKERVQGQNPFGEIGGLATPPAGG